MNFNDDLRLALDLVVSMEMTRSTVSHPLWGQVLEGAEIAFHFLIFPSGPSELSHKPYHSEIVLENSGFLSIPILCHFEAESEPRSIPRKWPRNRTHHPRWKLVLFKTSNLLQNPMK